MGDSNRAGFPPIDKLIPHRPPMRLLEEIVEADDQALVGRGRIPREFGVAGWASPLLGVEIAAQGAAALEALLRSRGEGVRTGYLVTLRDARFQAAELPVEEPLEVSVRAARSFPPFATYEVTLATVDGGRPCLSATIGTYLLPPTRPTPPADPDR